MHPLRTVALAALLALWAGAAPAAPQSTAAPAGSAPATPSRTGACVLTSTAGTTSCSEPVDEAGCRAQALETQAKAVFKAGQDCR